MKKIKASLKVSFKKGLFIGLLDLVFRVVSLALWLWTVKVLGGFVMYALFDEYMPAARTWWLVYSALMFLTATTLAYTAVYDRE
jgi:hypothetical protein